MIRRISKGHDKLQNDIQLLYSESNESQLTTEQITSRAFPRMKISSEQCNNTVVIAISGDKALSKTSDNFFFSLDLDFQIKCNKSLIQVVYSVWFSYLSLTYTVQSVRINVVVIKYLKLLNYQMKYGRNVHAI